jgi:hypothetical protein
MKYTAATLALVAGATAHTVMSEIYIDGEGMGSGTCVRAPKNPVGAVDPVIDLGSSDMACGKDGTKGVARTCPITGGHQISFEYRQWPEDYSRGPLDMGHMGPCAVYLKKVEDATTDTAEGDGWFKLWDEGYDESSGKWCTQKMIGNAGRISVTIPSQHRRQGPARVLRWLRPGLPRVIWLFRPREDCLHPRIHQQVRPRQPVQRFRQAPQALHHPWP